MNVEDLYPIRKCCDDPYGWPRNPEAATEIWLRLRDEDEEIKETTWYGLDLTIHSREKVTIHVRDIADSFSGGIGAVVFECDVDRFTLKEQNEIDRLIEERKMLYAEDEFNRREEAKRLAAIKAVRDELFGTD